MTDTTAADSDGSEWWRRCEIAWLARLQANGYAVTSLAEAVGNSLGTRAPLTEIGGRRVRSPDLLSTRSSVSEYWEIKYRNRADIDLLTGRHEFWMDRAAFEDYLRLSSSARVWIVVYERAPDGGRWLQADVRDVRTSGRTDMRFGQGGLEVEAWVWPADVMETVAAGPPVSDPGLPQPLLPDEGDQTPIPIDRYQPFERRLRRRRPSEESETTGSPEAQVIGADASVALDVLRRSLGIPELPRYSVLRIGGRHTMPDEILELMHYGIRVFLITSPEAPPSMPPAELVAFEDARLVERSTVAGTDDLDIWVVDGRVRPEDADTVETFLAAADDGGGINAGQYRIVHAAEGADVLVAAGAGTGKTETMCERLVFLLATTDTSVDPANLGSPTDLRLDQIVLVTFSNESAREMRTRIARTLLLRRRLCARCVLPAVAWMMQLSNTQISTIHSYAKRLVSADGATIGIPPGFVVSARTLDFRELVYDALSPHVEVLLRGSFSDRIPPVHELREHVEAIWRDLENRGVRLLDPANGSSAVAGVDWGSVDPNGSLDAEVARIVGEVIDDVARRFTELCRREQTVPLAQLVPSAVDVVAACGERLSRPPRYVFVDEFQDTDPTQLELVLRLKQQTGAALFVVGDIKQGVYRFRGAEGNAFAELETQWRARGLGGLTSMSLTRNFRSGGRLLDSLHPLFASWGTAGWLDYADDDRLKPASGATASEPVRVVHRAKWSQAARAVEVVTGWRDGDPDGSMAVLCRNNFQAMDVQRILQKAGVACQLLVGGSFFQSPAVRELRVVLECVVDPAERASVLELCETRWFAGLCTMGAPDGFAGGESPWSTPVPPILAWRDRVASLDASDTVDTTDLELVTARVQDLRSMLETRSVLAWIVECSRLMDPKRTVLPGPDDESERRRYGRCFDHLLTLIDETFADAPVSVIRLLDWLRLQIAVNRTEDEPFEQEDVEGRITALTVHKSKGLEFDRVLVPNTWTSFDPFESPYTSITRQIAVLPDASGRRRLAWRWALSTQTTLTNVPDVDIGVWGVERAEMVRDEARLLYVALTRAKKELVVFVQHEPGRARSSEPGSWGDLLATGAVR